MGVAPIPEGFHSVTPYLVVEGVDRLIEFAKAAFDATVIYSAKGPNGKTIHAEIKIGDSIVMMGEASEQAKPTTSMLYLYVTDADARFKQAIQAGGKAIAEPIDQFYGDRSGGLSDPFGNEWWIATRIKDVSQMRSAAQ